MGPIMAPLPSWAMSPLADDEPVLVGVGQAVHRPQDGPVPSLVEIMTTATRRAGGEIGPAVPGARSGWVGVPKGAWTHPDPGREVAGRGRRPGRPHRPGRGRDHPAGDDRRRPDRRAGRVGVRRSSSAARSTTRRSTGAAAAVGEARRAAVEPDEHLVVPRPGHQRGGVQPAVRRPPDGLRRAGERVRRARGLDRGRAPASAGRLTESFAAEASWNAYAWNREAPSADDIVTPSADNRMIAEPYTKLCCSNLRVNQSAALLFTTVEDARAAQDPREPVALPPGHRLLQPRRARRPAGRPRADRSSPARRAGGRWTLAGVTSDGLAARRPLLLLPRRRADHRPRAGHPPANDS